MRNGSPSVRRHPQQVGAIDQAKQAVVIEVLGVLAPLFHPEVDEEPADVRVDEAARRAEHAVAVADMG